MAAKAAQNLAANNAFMFASRQPADHKTAFTVSPAARPAARPAALSPMPVPVAAPVSELSPMPVAAPVASISPASIPVAQVVSAGVSPAASAPMYHEPPAASGYAAPVEVDASAPPPAYEDEMGGYMNPE
eukprot:CAMPEP_0167809590 /NCGR_PEP_ID=MMETSP0111_2-20121227/23884_1 /TAXON_ID=91324 /ORGANISM="Lotharella globosa, Strain CCCM811" /LENGTH=129 /DNA_ID=CAMNT_0007708003 /DNA_START=297 /DNA_END=686 /DNA_ORIENTATION=+